MNGADTTNLQGSNSIITNAVDTIIFPRSNSVTTNGVETINLRGSNSIITNGVDTIIFPRSNSVTTNSADTIDLPRSHDQHPTTTSQYFELGYSLMDDSL